MEAKKKKLLVCINHELTPQQLEELREWDIRYLKEVDDLLFRSLTQCPGDVTNVVALAANLCDMIEYDFFSGVLLPIGSPALMFSFAREVGDHLPPGIEFLFSHSVRDSVDVTQEDGSVVKKAVFKHSHFISL